MTTRTYTKLINPEKLGDEILAGTGYRLIKESDIDVPDGYMSANGDQVLLNFYTDLNAEEIATVDIIVTNHTP